MPYAHLADLLMHRKSQVATGITFITGSQSEEFLSYAALYEASVRVLACLQERGLQPQDELVFQLEDNKMFVIVFWACILGGIVPVPLTVGNNEEHRHKLFSIWPVLNHPWLIIPAAAFDRLRRDTTFGDTHEQMAQRLIAQETIFLSRQKAHITSPKGSDLAFIQFSSGSTGTPKGVMVTHDNLLANVAGIARAAHYTPDDVLLSWMPLTHDMGLIGFHISPLFSGLPQCLMSTNAFVRRPALWMEKASEHRATVLCSPNFGYRYFMKHYQADGQYQWELSRVRIIYNGAEPIAEKLCRDFLRLLAPVGLHSHAMCPVYGLAEATLAVSISPPAAAVAALEADRHCLQVGTRITSPVSPDRAVSFVDLGPAIHNCAIRIMDDAAQSVDDGVIGHVLIKGEGVTAGYYNNQAATDALVTTDGWLRTGDLGFVQQGHLYITGRAKDIIFVHGQNYYPHDIERVAEDLPGIELNKIAVGGYYNTDTHQEEIVAFVFHRGGYTDFLPIVSTLKAHINNKTGLDINRVVPVNDIPRTTSGKLQRFRLLERLQQGIYQEAEAALHKLLLESEAHHTKAVPPANDQETMLLTIWRQVLGESISGVEQSFFHYGGNSLKATEMTMLLLKETGIEVTLSTVYEQPTIRQLAVVLPIPSATAYVQIPVAPVQAWYPLSAAQQRLYYAWELNKDSVAYNTPVAVRIQGAVTPGRLEHCLRQLLNRHDILRAVFHLADHPLLQIQEPVDFRLVTLCCSPDRLQQELQDLVQPFDLWQGPLYRIRLLEVTGSDSVLFLDLHHTITDGVSLYHFLEELLTLYAGEALAPLPVQYTDYLSLAGSQTSRETWRNQEAWWLAYLPSALPVLQLPLDLPRPVVFDTAGAKLSFSFTPDQSRQLRSLATAQGCNLHVLLFTLYQVLLSKYTGQEILVTGIPVAGRRHPDLRAMQGLFVNNLAICTEVKGTLSFIQLLKQQQRDMTAALNNQDYPFDKLVQALDGRRDAGRNPLFDTMFLYQNIGMPEVPRSPIQLAWHFFDPGFSKFDLSMEVIEHAGQLQYHIEYATRLFSPATIEKLETHFRQLTDRVLANPSADIASLLLVSDTAYHHLIHTFNDTVCNYPDNSTIHELFEKQVAATPHHIALDCGGEQLTYQQVDERANALALTLRGRGVAPDVVTGILLPRSPALIISMLAILKAGGCFLPIDTDLPAQRVHYLLSDSRCGLVITDSRLQHQLQADSVNNMIVLNVDTPGLLDGQAEYIEPVNTERDLAYVIYTSGTTGRPKGVMIEHRSLVNYCWWAASHYVGNQLSTFPFYTSVSFDLTITSLFVPLLTGNKIVIYREDGQVSLIEQVLANDQVDIVKLTPSHLKLLRENNRQLPAGGSRITRLIVGGEDLSVRTARDMVELFGEGIEIFNEYGPTEATVGCMIHRYSPADAQWQSVPIGVPAPNTRIYVLDNALQPVPEGVHGELYIGGDALARGYLHNQELTQEKFIDDPFVAGKKLYKTGDRVRRLPDGSLVFIGRYDAEVKINGHRIGLPEIEQQLMAYPAITEALVAVRKNKREQQQLYAWYRSQAVLEAATLREHLASRLPYYMIPVRFIAVATIPLTRNGKVNYDALPEPEEAAADQQPARSQHPAEQLSLAVWEEILGVSGLTINDNFFEVGGDSIKAVQIASRLMNKGIAIDTKDILTYHTIEQVVARARKPAAGPVYQQSAITGERVPGPVEAWFLAQQLAHPHYYNQSVLLQWQQPVDLTRLAAAFEKLIVHHDGLRINYDAQRQVFFYNNALLDQPFPIDTFSFAGEAALIRIAESLKASFNIHHGLLLKAALLNDVTGTQFLLITAHHLVTDGVTWRILLEDLYTVYTALEKGQLAQLPPKTASYAVWQQALAAHGTTAEAALYQHAARAVGFTLPMDAAPADWQSRHRAVVSRTLDKVSTNFLLRDAHKAYKTNVPMLLNLALARVLHDWTGKRHFVIEQESHGRQLETVDVSRTAGWFTLLYPMIITLPEDHPGSQLKMVKEQWKEALAHSLSAVDRRAAGHGQDGSVAMPEIRFNYLGQFNTEFDNDLFVYSDLPHGVDIAPENNLTAKLEINALVVAGELQVHLQYHSKAYEYATLQWLLDSLFRQLALILEHLDGEQEAHFTPSDFDAIKLDQEEIDSLFQ